MVISTMRTRHRRPSLTHYFVLLRIISYGFPHVAFLSIASCKKFLPNILVKLLTRHILLQSSRIGDPDALGLDPKKLAAFYRIVGGNYDALFIEAPDESISYIWRALGVHHILKQPSGPVPGLYFEQPTIPALTIQGFARWESIQILLEPQEHAPFIQFAVRNWALRHPDTGELFPPDLPKEAFPAECDPVIDAWHKKCADRLRTEAIAQQERMNTQQPQAQSPPIRDPRVDAGFSHFQSPQVPRSPPPTQRHRPEMDYFTRERPAQERPAAPLFAHVHPTCHPRSHNGSPYSPIRRRMHSSSMDDPPRRRSFSDLKESPEHPKRFTEYLGARPNIVPRRHSQPRHYSSPSSSSAESISSGHTHSRPTSSGGRLYTHQPPMQPPPSIRRSGPPPSGPTSVPVTVIRAHRPDPSPDDPRRRSRPADLKDRLVSFLSGSHTHDRRRSSSREHNGPGPGPGTPPIRTARYRSGSGRITPPPPIRRATHWSDASYPSDESDSGVSPKHRMRQDRAREHAQNKLGMERDRLERNRERMREERDIRSRRDRDKDRERDWDRDRDRDRDKTYLRPTADRRPSSHADAERALQREREAAAWERERGRGRGRADGYERDRAGGGSSGGGSRRLATSEERELFERNRDRDRRRWKERGPSPVVSATTTGVGGRRYPSASVDDPWD